MALRSLPSLRELSRLALLCSLFGFYLHLLVLDIEAQSVVDADVLVRHPDQGKIPASQGFQYSESLFDL